MFPVQLVAARVTPWGLAELLRKTTEAAFRISFARFISAIPLRSWFSTVHSSALPRSRAHDERHRGRAAHRCHVPPAAPAVSWRKLLEGAFKLEADRPFRRIRDL
ncbi:hypothetical protein GCM10009646_61400 [Streptomyces aureus]